MNIPILIIAAGASRRLGQPKQLLSYQGTVLVNYAIQQALGSELGPVFVVLGANEERIRPHLTLPEAQVFYCEKWAEGMSTTIAYGARQIVEQCPSGLIVSLADQPFLQSAHFNALIAQYNVTNAPVVISKYEEGQGPPTFFNEAVVPELLGLSGDDGAKQVVKRYRDRLSKVDFPQGYLDIDTPGDLYLLSW